MPYADPEKRRAAGRERMRRWRAANPERTLEIGQKSEQNRVRPELYAVWVGMKQRCTNPKATGYERYGGRGVTICERWADSYEAFIEDIGNRPSPGYTVDRIDPNGNYEPGNVRWATWVEQANNRRPRCA